MSKQNQLTTPPGIVIKAEKRVPYSVINITDINAYRQERHEYEIAWEKKYVEKQAVARAMVYDLVTEQSKNLTFSEHEKAEIAYRTTRSDDYTYIKPQKFTSGNYNNENIAAKAKYDNLVDSMFVSVKPTISQRFSNLVAKLMKSGFGW